MRVIRISMQRPMKVRFRPRISAPKLGEYLEVGAHRRQRILHDQKFPPDYITTRYKDANNAIRVALLSGENVIGRLQHMAQQIANRVATSKYQDDTNSCCVQAIHRFTKLYPTLPLNGVNAVITRPQGFPLTVKSVEISVWPTVLLTRVSRSGSVETGALLLTYRKGSPLREGSGGVIAELLRSALVATNHQNVKPKLCMVVDVFSNGIFVAPTRSKRLYSEIESACREIAVMWDAIAA